MTTTEPAVRAQGLTKDYGEHRALRDASFEVRPGEIFGYLGPNGAGKTTTIRLLLDLIRPTAGHLEVLGRDPRAAGLEVRRRTGYLPGELVLYEHLTGRQHIGYLSSLRGVTDLSYAYELAERLELDLDRPIRKLSKGNKQKVGLVQAFAHRPELLILDEPTAGLDPLVQQTLHAILGEIRAEGRTVFLSSHVLSEVERVADRVGIIRDGAIVVVEEVGALKTRAIRRLVIRFPDPPERSAFAGVEAVQDVEISGKQARVVVAGPMDTLIRAIAPLGVLDITTEEAKLEEVFLTYYRDAGEGAEDGP